MRKISVKIVPGNKKFPEELIAYFPFTVIWVYVMINRKKLRHVCIMKPIKQYSLGGYSVGITDGSGLWSWGGLRWHDTHTKFHEDWFGPSSNIKVITSTIREATVLVLLIGRNYYSCLWVDLRRLDMYIPSFMTTDSGIRVILRVLPQQLERL
jgi:hypothetical protein